MPLHPRTRKLAECANIVPGKNVAWLEPASYFAMLGYIEHAAFVVTDSGGVQKEAYYLGKRCITAHDETEWTELVACDANRVVGHDPAALEWHLTGLPCLWQRIAMYMVKAMQVSGWQGF